MRKEFSIMEQLCFCTTRIETEDSKGGKYTGTGFFLNLKIDDKTIPLVVTNKHVVKNMSKGMFKMTEADTENNPIYSKHFTVEVSNNFEQIWTLHPDPNVDLCVLPINIIIEIAAKQRKTFFYKSIDNSLIPSQDLLETLDAVEEVCMIGYPNGLWDALNNMPIVRRGTTATDIKLDYNGKKEFLIDAACYPGSSGSPVFICNVGGYTDKKGNLNWGNSRIIFLGILYAGPQLTTAGEIRIIDIPTIQTPIPVTSIPVNLGIIIKAEKILDFIKVLKEKYNI